MTSRGPDRTALACRPESCRTAASRRPPIVVEGLGLPGAVGRPARTSPPPGPEPKIRRCESFVHMLASVGGPDVNFLSGVWRATSHTQIRAPRRRSRPPPGPIGRHAWLAVGGGGQRCRQRPLRPADPPTPACEPSCRQRDGSTYTRVPSSATSNSPPPIGLIARRGNTHRRSAGLQPVGIERDGHQRGPLYVDEVAASAPRLASPLARDIVRVAAAGTNTLYVRSRGRGRRPAPHRALRWQRRW